MGATIEIEEAEVIDLRREANFRRALHKKSMQREAELREELRDKKQTIKELRAQGEAKDRKIQEQAARIEWFENKLFGRSTEQRDQQSPGSREEEEKAPKQSQGTKQKGEKRRNRGQQPGTEGHGRRRRTELPTEEMFHDLPPDERCCPHCGTLYRESTRTEDSEQIEYEVKVYRVVHRRRCYFRRCGCEQSPVCITAPVPPKIVPKGLVHRSLLSHILLDKWLLHRPLGRILEALRLRGLDLSQGTVTGTLKRTTEMFRPLYGRLLGRSASADRWQMDETGWMVFLPVENEQTSSRWWLWVVITEDAVVYLLEPSRSGQVPKRHLGEDASGILLVDRYGGYKVLPEGIIRAFCWAHVRRDFVRIADSDSYETLHGWAEEWIDRIAKLYRLNRERLEVIDDEQAFARADRRLRKATGKMARIRDEQLADGDLHEKARGVLKSLAEHWDGCTVFVEHPEIPMDNNECERRLRGPVCGRKNFFGCGSEWSAELTAMLYSAFSTLRQNDINPALWLDAYLEACAEAGGRAPEEDTLENFLPWNLPEERKEEWKLSDKPP